MFTSVTGFGVMTLRLVHFGGGRVIDHGWKMNGRDVAAIMKGVNCEGGYTQILPGLRLFLCGDPLPQTVILIGDAFEEDAQKMTALAQDLKSADIKVFAFIEGEDETAAYAFRYLADTTGGTFARFGTDLPLRDLCEGVALLTAGGKSAVKQVRNKRVERLLLTGPADHKD